MIGREDWSHVAAEGLSVPIVARAATGRGVLVAVVDTGINFQHPHVRSPPRGYAIAWKDGELAIGAGDCSDHYGHGTCVAALIRFLAPDAELMAVRVAERSSTDADRLSSGIELAAKEGARIVAVPMGTRTLLARGIEEAVASAMRAGAVIVAAAPDDDVLPAALPGVLGARHEDGVDVVLREGRIFAEGRARPSGSPSNFWGPSLSTARVVAALARCAEQDGRIGADLALGFSKLLEVR